MHEISVDYFYISVNINNQPIILKQGYAKNSSFVIGIFMCIIAHETKREDNHDISC